MTYAIRRYPVHLIDVVQFADGRRVLAELSGFGSLF